MLRSLAENGSPRPLLETDEERIYFLATLYARKLDESHASAVSERVRKAVERRSRLLSFFSEHPTSTTAEASSALGVARSTVNRDIAELKLDGRLAHEGPTKGGTWVVS